MTPNAVCRKPPEQPRSFGPKPQGASAVIQHQAPQVCAHHCRLRSIQRGRRHGGPADLCRPRAVSAQRPSRRSLFNRRGEWPQVRAHQSQSCCGKRILAGADADDLAAGGVSRSACWARLRRCEIVAEFLRRVEGYGSAIPIVLDPVLRSSSGGMSCCQQNALVRPCITNACCPWVNWVTPNWRELGVLSGRAVEEMAAAKEAMAALSERHPRLTIVATGGDCERPLDLLGLPGGAVHRFEGEHIETRSTHGTGCAFSSALLARLVGGATPVEAVAGAKQFVEEALRNAPGLGRGRGPMDLLWPMRGRVSG